MWQFLVRRLFLALFTLLLVTFGVFGLIRAMPGDPALLKMSNLDPTRRMRPEDLLAQRRMFGLDKPFYVAYVEWIGDLSQGNMQRSFSFRAPVSSVIAERLPRTLLLTVVSLILDFMLAIPLGLYQTARSGRPDERGISFLLFMLYSLPAFVGALFLQLLFAVYLNWLPLFGMEGPGHGQMSPLQQTWDLFKHAVLPVTALSYGSLAYYSRFIKANMNEVIRQDYIRTARAKGVGPLTVLCWHAFRNSLIPLVTLLGLTLPGLLSAGVILERIFSWPGIGSLFFEAITTRDYPLIMGLVLMFSVITLLGQLLADILYAMVDPRVTYS